jgi:hypothetical protein
MEFEKTKTNTLIVGDQDDPTENENYFSLSCNNFEPPVDFLPKYLKNK